jgi:transglutaminase-like putative cysteine protease
MAQPLPTLNVHKGVIPPAIELYFQVCLFLLIVTGFVTLASTGNLDFISVTFVGAALLLKGYGLWRRREFRIPERIASYLGLAYLALYVADFFLISQNFVQATVHLVLFGMVVKLFSIQRNRDFLYLAILAFLEVLSAAILTVDSIFLGALSVFLLIAVLTFIALEMRRSAAVSDRMQSGSLEHSDVVRKVRRLKVFSYSLSLTGVVLVMAILIFASGIFFLLPRLSGGYLSKLAQQSDLVTGFSDSVSLGEIGRIQQSSQVMMHVRLEKGQRGQDLRLRGNTLSTFDGKKWFNPPHELQNLVNTSGMFDLRSYVSANQRLAVGRQSEVLHYRVVMEPIGTNVIFTIPSASYIFGPFRELSADRSQIFINTDRERSTNVYSGLSNLSSPSMEELQSSSGEIPAGVASRYLQLPELDPRIPKLAEELTSRSKNNIERAAAIESYLFRFKYTLELPSEKVKDPLANFLFVRKEGHCEYFASAMAIMLRTLGIPSRIVTGFHGGEFNELTGNYIIRAKDAHSWVEAYFPGVGWVTFDPTPAGAEPAITVWTRLQLYVDAMREFWREWVVNYDFMHQQRLGTAALSAGTKAVERFRLWTHRQYERMMMLARKSQDSLQNSPRKFGSIATICIVGLVLLLNSPGIIRAMRRGRLARNPSREPSSAAAIWYTRMIAAMARKGHPKRPTESPEEFVAKIQNASLRQGVAKFTEHYERARFGNSADDAVKLPQIYEELVSKKD